MAGFEQTYTDNHRRQLSIVFMMSLATLVLATVPRHERALFITDGPGISAFVANVPPVGPAVGSGIPASLFAPAVPSEFYTPRPAVGIGPTVRGLSPGGGSPMPFSAPAESGSPVGTNTQLASVGPTGGSPAGGSDFPFSPPSLGGTSASPVVPATTTAVTPGTTTTTTPGVVAAVPEPASWAMLIVGLAIVGTFLRRRASPKVVDA